MRTTTMKAAESGVRNKRKRNRREKDGKDTPPIIAVAPQNQYAGDESDAEKEESALTAVLLSVRKATIGTSDENDTEKESARNVLPARIMHPVGAIADLARGTRRTTHLLTATKSTNVKPKRIRMRPLLANNCWRL
jgi:hypothetical protein